MVGFFECVQQMVPNSSDRAKISKELEFYRRAETFGFDMVVQDRKTLMSSKLHLVLIFKFQIFFFLCLKFQSLYLCFLYSL